MLVLILVVAAGASLITGWLLGITVLVYVALAVSAIGLGLIVVDGMRRRRRARADGTPVDDDLEPEAVPEAAAEPESVPEPAFAPDSAVYVVAGRKRFHVSGCPSLADSDPQELTLAEAREESFTPCTRCVDEAARTQLV